MTLGDQLNLKLIEIKNETEYRSTHRFYWGYGKTIEGVTKLLSPSFVRQIEATFSSHSIAPLMLMNEEDALYPPWFFTWIDKKLAAFAWPQTRGNMEYLWQIGIRHIITLCPEKIPDISESSFSWTYIPIQECHAPSIEDIFKFIRTVQWCRKWNLQLGVHCRLGLGRTGVMVAIYLMYFHGMTAEQALKNLRYLRPGSVDSPVQEECILNYRPAAKIANEQRLRKITRKSDHFLSFLKNNERHGAWGLPRLDYVIPKEN